MLLFSRSPEILVDSQFVIENLLNVLRKTNATRICALVQKHKRCWPDFAAFVASTNTSCYINVWLTCYCLVNLLHASINTDLSRGAYLQRGHVNVLWAKYIYIYQFSEVTNI